MEFYKKNLVEKDSCIRNAILIGILIVSFSLNSCKKQQNKTKPNILWLSVEDLSCNLPCYGDSTAKTPNIDRLAAEGIVFDNAYSVSGVCSPSRSSIITAMYPSYMGTANHRTYGVDIPKEARAFTAYLREAGYYCTNNPKEDYNFKTPEEAWDETGFSAHYYHREDKNQPFFQVYNILATHSSQIWCNSWEHMTVEPDSVPVPLYFPQNNEVVKKDVARKYSNIELMDLFIGQKLRMLEEQDLLDKTIIVFWSDHGGMLPRQKRAAYHSGLKVPLIVRFPDKSHAGERVNDLVSLMDLGPTMLSLVGIDKPEHMQGKVILGEHKEKPRTTIVGLKDRAGSEVDLSRSITDGRYRYVRNYYPEFRQFRHSWYVFQMAMMRELFRLFKQDAITGLAKTWFNKRPTEVLFDTYEDVDEVYNLADKPEYKEKLQELRDELLKWQQNTTDVCLLPEGDVRILQAKYNMPVADYLDQHPAYYQKILETANKSLFPSDNVSNLVNALHDTIPSVRYWAVRGIGRLGHDGRQYIGELKKLRNDPSISVRAALAWAFDKLDYDVEAKAIYEEILKMEYDLNDNPGRIIQPKVLALSYLTDSKKIARQLETEIRWVYDNERPIMMRGAQNVLKELEIKKMSN